MSASERGSRTEAERRYETIVRLGGAICAQSIGRRDELAHCPEVLTLGQGAGNLYCSIHGLVSTLGWRANMEDIDENDPAQYVAACRRMLAGD